MNIFITGIAGFLGSHLAKFYLNKGNKVFGNDTLDGGYEDNIPKDAKFYKIPCEDNSKLKQLFKGIDVVIHTAAFAHEGLSIFSPYTITSNIISGSVSVFSAAISSNVKRIVHCSSMARYGEIKPPFKETDEPKPVDPYGIAKLASEKILINLCEVHDVEYNIAIPHNIIGPNQKYDDPFRNVASIMINLILQNRSPIIYGDGNQKRSFSDVRDCIDCIDSMVTHEDIKSQIINIGPGEENYITINRLFEIISNKLQFNKKPEFYPDRTNEVKYPLCSSKKAEKLLGYKTKYSVEQSIDTIIQYIKERGTRKFLYNYDLEIINDKTPETWKNRLF